MERFDQMFHVNVRGVFLWLRAALPSLKASSAASQICVTSSVMGSRPVAQAAPYCASKYAVNGLVLSLRAELKAAGHSHIKCGLVCPAGVATPWWEESKRGFAAADGDARRLQIPDGGGGCGRASACSSSMRLQMSRVSCSMPRAET